MKLSNFIIEKKSLILTFAIFFLFLGILQFFIMPREEDPRLKERNGVVKIVYPGASVSDVKKLLAVPVEEALAEVPEIKKLEIRIRPEVMVAEIQLLDTLSSDESINSSWKRCEDALLQIRFPSGILAWSLNRRVLDQDAILISVSGGDSVFLKENTESLRESIMQISSVSKVNRIADPEEEVVIFVKKTDLESRGLSLKFLMDWIGFANHNIPPGTFPFDGKKAIIKTDAWFENLTSIQDLPIPLSSGMVEPLGGFAKIQKKHKNPPNSLMRWNGEDVIGYGIVPKKNINLVEFGEQVAEAVAIWQNANPGIKVEIINSQPNYVKLRLRELGGNLVSGVAIVALVLVSMMGFRLGLLSSLLVPMIAITSLGVYGMFGGVLHQISIAAFVMALGLLIDNVIVVLESIQEKLDAGTDSLTAVKSSISNLAFPLFSATGTTLAAFIPMLGSSGGPADFTRAIPTINMLTLAISFVFAVFVTPILGFYFLKPKVKKTESRLEQISFKIGNWIPANSRLVLLTSFILLAISVVGLGKLPKKFFPDADRDQLLIDLRLPEGTNIDKTKEVATKIESHLFLDPRIKSVSVFLGQTTPLFYYNVEQSPNSPHIAQFIVKTSSLKENLAIKKDLETYFDAELLEGNIVVSELKQGPPTKAPIEIRVFSESESERKKVHDELILGMHKIPGLRVIRSNLGVGTPSLQILADDASLSRYRTTRSDLSLSILAQTQGINVSSFLAGERGIPIVIRTVELDKVNPKTLADSDFIATRTNSIPLERVSQMEMSFAPSMIYRKDRKTGFSIFSEVKDGFTADQVANEVSKLIQSKNYPKTVQIEWGGENSESGEANRSLLAVAPLGIVLLVGFLLLEFGTWKKVGIILLTVPLCIIGVVIGLGVSGKPFGFLSLLGIFALVGIVVNNGILILDYIGSSLGEGESLENSIVYSLQKRIRPILLTTLTTIAGLLPLAVTDATLWPPFAYTMIFGLLVSTLLTLFVIPSAYYLLYKEKPVKQRNSKLKMAILGFFLVVIPLQAEEKEAVKTITWTDVIQLASESPRVKLAYEEYKRKVLEKDYVKKATYYPKLGVSVEQIQRDRTLVPNAAIQIVPGIHKSYWTGGVEIQQTIFDPSVWFAVEKALSFSEEASKLASKRAVETAQADSLLAYITVFKIRTKIQNLDLLKSNLTKRQSELKRLFFLGQVSESELFRIDQTITQTKIGIADLEEKEQIALLNLGRLLGLEEKIRVDTLPGVNDLFVTSGEGKDQERLEIIALKKKIQALEEKKKGIQYEALPKLTGKAGVYYLNNNQFTTDNWAQVSVGLTVNPFDGGLRKNREEEIESEIRSTITEWNDLIKLLELEKEDLNSQIRVKRNEIDTRVSLVQRAKSASNKEYIRMKEGKININIWIDSETLYSEEKDRYETVQLEYLETLVKFRNCLGIGFP